ncbi:hypothetical protein KKB11_01655, partial [Candidatus Micrarchaeota archaeon]|nr:hypothetical protein [Candidatus Micrarchaeota archaeon]
HYFIILVCFNLVMPSKKKSVKIKKQAKQAELFGVKPVSVLSSNAKTRVSKLINLMQSSFELKRMTAQDIERLKELNRLPKKKMSYDEVNEKRSILKQLKEKRLSEEEITSLLRKRISLKATFDAKVRQEISSLVFSLDLSQQEINSIRNKVRGWNFVKKNDSADINFHFLIELERISLQRKTKT